MLPGGEDLLVREEPLVLEFGGSELVTMRTPGDDFHLGLGFFLGEGIIKSPAEILASAFVPGDPAALRADRQSFTPRDAGPTAARGRLSRTHEIRSSCGICGLTDADELLEETRPLLPSVPRVGAATLAGIVERFPDLQPLFAATGACHGAALFAADGSLLGHGEDVGRHNALDKAIGRAAASGHDLRQAIAMLSGRAGYDLVMKCLRLGVPVILSVSAASALSVDLCTAAGATLIGFVRSERLPDRIKVYSDGGRLVG